MRWLWALIGVLLLAAGVVWALQGFGVLPGSFMSGSLTWAIIGPIVALAGLVIIILALRRRSAPTV
jgi:hypothetical protein